MKKVCIAGYAGHGYVIAEIAKLLQYTLVGYIDLEEKKSNPFQLAFLGKESDIDFMQLIKDDIHIALGIGANSLRKKLYEILKSKNVIVETLQHPKTSVSSLSTIGEGTIVMSSAVVNPLVKIGKGVICNSGCIIEHECIIDDFAHIAPGAVLAGNVSVGNSTLIGGNVFVKQGVTIGKNVIIGAGSVVLNDVGDGATVYGNPAKFKL